MLALGLLALTFAGSFVLAQNPTVAQTQACAASIYRTDFELEVTYSSADTNSFTATWSYDPTACTSPQIVPVVRIQLRNDIESTLIKCTGGAFGSSGILTTTCSTTYGDIATAAQQQGDTDWATAVTIGNARTYSVVIEQTFFVTGTTPPTPSGDFSRRKRNVNTNLNCSNGQSWCRTGPKNFECVHTSTDVNACGACPYEDQAVDCTTIEGVDNVECEAASCRVNSCLRGYRVSPDRKSCLRQDMTLVS